MTMSGNARLAGVMGWPVAHSLSPRLHGYWLKHHGIDGAYVPLAVAPEDFAAVLRQLPAMGFAGVNVTLPHKEAALAAVDTVDDLAARIGAVNTIVIDDQGRLAGSNSDAFGFMENLRAGAADWQATKGPAVILGAGGATRAIAAALLDGGVPAVRLVNRTPERAQALAAELDGPITVVPWQDRGAALREAALLVNATTLGMAGNPPLEIDLTALPSDAVVTDIVYAPLETALLDAAAGRGNRVVDGLGMLLHQARPGFAAWFGVEPKVTPALRAFVLEG
jgi:shikimate dehydrogenase